MLLWEHYSRMRYMTGTFDVIIGNGSTSFRHAELHAAGQISLESGDIGFHNICFRFLHEQTVVVITNEGGFKKTNVKYQYVSGPFILPNL